MNILIAQEIVAKLWRQHNCEQAIMDAKGIDCGDLMELMEALDVPPVVGSITQEEFVRAPKKAISIADKHSQITITDSVGRPRAIVSSPKDKKPIIE